MFSHEYKLRAMITAIQWYQYLIFEKTRDKWYWRESLTTNTVCLYPLKVYGRRSSQNQLLYSTHSYLQKRKGTTAVI